MSTMTRELIKSIYFFDGDEIEMDRNEQGISNCIVATTNYFYITNIDPNRTRHSDANIFVIDENFTEIALGRFIDEELIIVSDDLDELKQNPIFAKNWQRYRVYGSKSFRNSKFIKFETTNGTFYVVASVDHDGRHDIEIKFGRLEIS